MSDTFTFVMAWVKMPTFRFQKKTSSSFTTNSQRFGSSNEVPHPLIVAEEFPHARHAHPNDDFENEPIRHQKISGTRVTLQGGSL